MMDHDALLGLFVTNLLLILTPGPFLALLVSRCARGGVTAAARLTLGNLLVTLLYLGAALGLRELVTGLDGRTEEMLGWIGIPILFWLSWRTLRPGPARPGWDRGTRDVVEGMLVAGSSPMMPLFYLALLPRFMPAGELGSGAILTVATIILLGEIIGAVVMMLLAARTLALGQGARRWIEVGAAGCLGLSAASATIAAVLG